MALNHQNLQVRSTQNLLVPSPRVARKQVVAAPVRGGLVWAVAEGAMPRTTEEEAATRLPSAIGKLAESPTSGGTAVAEGTASTAAWCEAAGGAEIASSAAVDADPSEACRRQSPVARAAKIDPGYM